MSRNRSRGRRGRRPGQGESDAPQPESNHENQLVAPDPENRTSATATPPSRPGTASPVAFSESRDPLAQGRSQGGRRPDSRQRSRGSQGPQEPQDRSAGPERPANQERGQRSRPQQSDGRPAPERGADRIGGARGQRPQGGDPASRQRRRQPRRRPSPIPVASEVVVKENVPIPVPLRPMSMRKISELGDGEHLNLGCPMLTRTRLALHASDGLRAGRCSLGWAVHGEDEVVLCLHTPNLLDCWKVHPERIAMIEAELDGDATAAD